jgi:histidine phosphotransfer protein HptB
MVRGDDMIDWIRVGELRDEVGEEGFAEVVELFLDEVEDVVGRLRAAPDPATYEQDLHFLKGGAWNLGFADFGALCQEGEKRAARGHADTVDIGAVIAAYVRSKAVFIAGLGDGSATAAPDAA